MEFLQSNKCSSDYAATNSSIDGISAIFKPGYVHYISQIWTEIDSKMTHAAHEATGTVASASLSLQLTMDFRNEQDRVGLGWTLSVIYFS